MQANPVSSTQSQPTNPAVFTPTKTAMVGITYLALAAISAVGASYIGIAAIGGAALTGLSVVLLLCSISVLHKCIQLLTAKGAIEPPPSPEQHALDKRTIQDPIKIEHRIAKATEAAKNSGTGPYSKAFNGALHSESLPTGHGSSIDVAGTSVGFAELQGMRPTMEDRHIAKSFSFKTENGEKSVKLFGIFDGHGGDEASEYVSKHIDEILTKKLEEHCKNDVTDAGVYNALRDTFVELDDRCRTVAGTTACVAITIDGGDLFVANTGDSRAILANGNSNLPFFGNQNQTLSKDQKPDSPDMLNGIRKRGGYVLNADFTGKISKQLDALRNLPFSWLFAEEKKQQDVPRVNGQLAVARAIGDWSILDFQNKFKVVSPLPKVTKFSRQAIKANSKLIIACDGLFDVAPASAQVTSAVNALGRKGKSNKEIAETLTAAAIKAGSTDNVSVMVVSL